VEERSDEKQRHQRDRKREDFRHLPFPFSAADSPHHGSHMPPPGRGYRQFDRQANRPERPPSSVRIVEAAAERLLQSVARCCASGAAGLARYWAPRSSGSPPARFQRASFILSELRCNPSTRAASLTLPPTSSSTR